jgi:hypothetical protein
VGTEDGANGAPTLAARYSCAFAAYLSGRGESALGAAYDLGPPERARHGDRRGSTETLTDERAQMAVPILK